MNCKIKEHYKRVKNYYQHNCDGDGEPYLSLFQKAIKIADDKNAVIYTTEERSEQSKIEWNDNEDSNERITIRWYISRPFKEGKRVVRLSPADAIADLYHEIAHLLQGRPNDEENRKGSEANILREERAWDMALDMLNEYNLEIPFNFYKEFENRKEFCLMTYKNSY